MTTIEFSNEFDVLISSYINSPEFERVNNIINTNFDEYEKSVFLTKAQEDLIISLYNGKNPFTNSFEKTEEIRSYLRNLIKNYKTEEVVNINNLSEITTCFNIPKDVWFITYESVDLEDESLESINGNNIIVVPTTQDEFAKIKNNPFRKASHSRVLRLDLGTNIVGLISQYKIKNYYIKYIAHPLPIIIDDLPDDLSINNISNRTECELNPVLHRLILENAVKLALESRVQYINK